MSLRLLRLLQVLVVFHGGSVIMVLDKICFLAMKQNTLILPSSCVTSRDAHFFGSQFGARDGVEGRDGCADEDENQCVSRPRRCAGSFFFS